MSCSSRMANRFSQNSRLLVDMTQSCFGTSHGKATRSYSGEINRLNVKREGGDGQLEETFPYDGELRTSYAVPMYLFFFPAFSSLAGRGRHLYRYLADTISVTSKIPYNTYHNTISFDVNSNILTLVKLARVIRMIRFHRLPPSPQHSNSRGLFPEIIQNREMLSCSWRREDSGLHVDNEVRRSRCLCTISLHK